MVESTNSQVQQIQTFWKKIFEDNMARTNAFYEELGKLDAKSTEQAGMFVEEAAKLAKESIAYASSLGAEWRRMTLETMKRGAESVNPGA